eukprot:COSAG02_NODE_5827_length_4009_cov_19.149105_3_plen_86_part_00
MWMVAMMALRRTPLPQPGWGLGRPRHSSIGASSGAGSSVGGAGLLLAMGGECVALQIAFCPLSHFLHVGVVHAAGWRGRAGQDLG